MKPYKSIFAEENETVWVNDKTKEEIKVDDMYDILDDGKKSGDITDDGDVTFTLKNGKKPLFLIMYNNGEGFAFESNKKKLEVPKTMYDVGKTDSSYLKKSLSKLVK